MSGMRGLHCHPPPRAFVRQVPICTHVCFGAAAPIHLPPRDKTRKSPRHNLQFEIQDSRIVVDGGYKLALFTVACVFSGGAQRALCYFPAGVGWAERVEEDGMGRQ